MPGSITVFGTEIQATLAMWVLLLVIFLITEACTVNLTTIWLAAGALVAGILAALGVDFIFQVIAFIVVSAILLFFTKPLADKYFRKRSHVTNKDSLIGVESYVTEKIDNISGTGYMRIADVFWSARSSDGSVIEVGTLVKVKEINGNKLIVAVSEK